MILNRSHVVSIVIEYKLIFSGHHIFWHLLESKTRTSPRANIPHEALSWSLAKKLLVRSPFPITVERAPGSSLPTASEKLLPTSSYKHLLTKQYETQHEPVASWNNPPVEDTEWVTPAQLPNLPKRALLNSLNPHLSYEMCGNILTIFVCFW